MVLAETLEKTATQVKKRPYEDQQALDFNAYLISRTPFNTTPEENHHNAKWYLHAKAAIADPKDSHFEREYVRILAAEVASQRSITPDLPEVIHFLAARDVIAYRETQRGFAPKAVAAVKAIR